MSNKKIFFTIACLFVFTNLLKAQKLHFSQMESLAPVLNPALTGVIPNGSGFRLAAVGRNQWSSFLGKESFQTMGVSFDMRNCLSDSFCGLLFNDSKFKSEMPTWGLGGQLLRDHSGVHSVRNVSDGTPPLVRTYASLSASALVPMNDKLTFSAGFKVGAQFHRLETDHLRYDEQFDSVSSFDNTISGEFDDVEALTSNSLDLGGGISVLYLGDKFGFSGGGAINYVLRPVEYNFTTDDDQPSVARKYTAHLKVAKSLYKMNQTNFGLIFKTVFLHQAPFQQWLPTLDLMFQHKEGFTFGAGSGLRISRKLSDGFLNDAVLGSVMVNYQSISVRFTADVNISDLRSATNNYGSAEISVIYHWKKKNSNCLPERGKKSKQRRGFEHLMNY